jgi:hypothetical protein
LSTPFNLASGWVERNRVRSAVSREMAVIGLDYWPDVLREEHKHSFLPKPSLWRRRTDPLADVGGYDFLRNTPGWNAEQICLAYALTEPSLATVQVTASTRRGRGPGRDGRARPAHRLLPPRSRWPASRPRKRRRQSVAPEAFAPKA